MLHRIGKKPSGHGGARGVVERLADCHDRIRRFTALAIRLGDEQPAPDEQIVEAATQTISYFEKSLPHHSADEEETIGPQLVGVESALDKIASQHLEIEATLRALLPLWKEVVAAPSARQGLLEDLRRHAEKLQQQFEEHLQLEESIMFPAIEKLSPELQEQLIREMALRRVRRTS
jgi:iron-sulfur cluster repair protein YtfE (RIC family)